jgi:hypothetical protein
VTALTLAVAAMAFNLSCPVTTTMDGLPVPSFEPHSYEFRIDLIGRRFCAGACTDVLPIARLTDTHLYLKLDDGPPVPFAEFIELDRQSLMLTYRAGNGHHSTSSQGICDVRAFTGFPPGKP